MLSHRIAGILKQYPNSEVAFFTAEVLLSGSGQYSRGRDVGVYLRSEAQYEGLVTGRERLHRDMEQLGLGSVGEYLVGAIGEGKWYNDARLDQNTPVDILAPWVARLVNRWLKTEPALPEGVNFGALQLRKYHAGRGKGWESTTGVPEADAIIEHYRSLHPLAKSIREIADWAVATHPDLMTLTVNQALHRSRRWHAQFKREKAAAEAPPSSVVFVSGDYTVHALTTREALEHEGHSQRHCVGSYWRQVAAGETLIFSVRSKKGIVATIEVNPQDGRVVQVRGPANRPVVKPDICEAALAFFAYMGYANPRGYCIPEIVYTAPPDQGVPVANPFEGYGPADVGLYDEPEPLWYVPDVGEPVVYWPPLGDPQPAVVLSASDDDRDPVLVGLAKGKQQLVPLTYLYASAVFEENPVPDEPVNDLAPDVDYAAEALIKRHGKRRMAGTTTAIVWVRYKPDDARVNRLVGVFERQQLTGLYERGRPRGVQLVPPASQWAHPYAIVYIETPEETAVWEAARTQRKTAALKAEADWRESRRRQIEACGRQSIFTPKR